MTQATFWGGPEVARPDVDYRPGCLFGFATLEGLRAELPLEQQTTAMYGSTFSVPRLEAWFGSRPYTFGGRTEHPKPWTPVLLEVLARVGDELGLSFDSCFANYYRDGNDCIAWHADDAPWIGPVIASVSFGSARRFVMQHKADKRAKHEWRLGDGDLFVMRAGVQRDWLHAVPRTTRKVGPRLNLTFRQTVNTESDR